MHCTGGTNATRSARIDQNAHNERRLHRFLGEPRQRVRLVSSSRQGWKCGPTIQPPSFALSHSRQKPNRARLPVPSATNGAEVRTRTESPNGRAHTHTPPLAGARASARRAALARGGWHGKGQTGRADIKPASSRSFISVFQQHLS